MDYSSNGDGFFALIALIILAAIFFLPTIIASHRTHKRTNGVLFLNLLIGWTGLGWLFLLVYAVLSDGD